MNEDDSAGGPIGYSPAPPAVIDRRSNISGSLQMSSGSAVTISSMPRLPSDRIPLQPQIHILNSRIPYQLQQNLQQKCANNSNIINSQSNNNTSITSANKTLSVVTSGSDNLNNVIHSSSSDSELLSLNKKRIKLEDGDDELSAIKKRILEHKYLRLKNVREKYSEHVAELFFLQTGGNMMDFSVWRKKAQTPQFHSFMKSYKLEQSLIDEPQNLQSTSATTDNNSTLPHGAEIKIPGVGVTPVAVSTTLPAAVAQLNQLGNLPGRPQGGRHGMVFGQIPVSPTLGNSSVPLVPGGKPLVLDPLSINSFSEKRRESLPSLSINTTQTTNGNSGNTGGGGIGSNSLPTGLGPEQFSAKARQEVYVMQRITELQKEGLWTEKRLPKLQEPARPKAHWDYLLEEMVWLAADFAQERKWKKGAAKKCARMVQKYFQDKTLAAQKAEKAQELHLKRIASFVAKEIKVFWNNVEKLVEYKQQTKLEEKRKKALDQHLSFIVDQTEKFSQQLVEGMNKSVDMNTSGAPSLSSSRISSPKPRNGSDDEFSPGNVSSDDDEETIAKAEAEQKEVTEEVAALQRESEMDLDDFLKELPKDYLQNRDKIKLPESDNSQSEKSDEEFQVTGDSSDDENTIMEQENSESVQDHKKEIEELNADNEMSIEDLIAKYKKTPMTEKMDLDSDESLSEDIDSDSDIDDENDVMDLDTEGSQSNDEKLDDFGLKTLLEDNKDIKSDKDDLINDAAAIAESIQPKGNTLSSTNVVTPVPFLLKYSLREYQHIGLDWLVTMHERKLNGILADEMGLGKTIQTISLLGHLACVKGIWGPHLIIVPSSVMLNWEMEFKKWCPGFKILTYYGTQKERKMKRIGWTKPNTFHVCITSYKLVIQDHQSFRRKKWKYLILDEAQNIKNFKSQRWQLLLNFNSDQRLLLTGTPLQNNLMELWSLMHFLMPHVFQSHREFKEWFSNPMTGMIEGNSEYNESIIKRLHKVLRPFLLRRLKCEVEKQMPKKYEHVVMCRLSKRQRFLYDDFMSRAKTKETLASGNLLSVINVLMQLRKVCNHPNLFEVRPTISPFRMEGISFRTASLVCNMLDYDPFKDINIKAINLVLIEIELCMTAYVAHRIKKLATPRKLIEEIDTIPEHPPQCPSGKLKLHVRIRDSRVQDSMINHSGVKVGTSPAMRTEGTKFVSFSNSLSESTNKKLPDSNVTLLPSQTVPPLTSTTTQAFNLRKRTDIGGRLNVSAGGHLAQIVQTSSGRHILLTPTNSGTTVVTQSGQRLTVLKNVGQTGRPTQNMLGKPIMKVSPLIASSSQIPSQGGSIAISQPLAAAIVHQWKNQTNSITTVSNTDATTKIIESEFHLIDKEQKRKEKRANQLQLISRINNRKCDASPIYGSDLRDCLTSLMKFCKSSSKTTCFTRSHINCHMTMNHRDENWSLAKIIKSYEERFKEMESVFNNFVLFVPPVTAPLPSLHISHPDPSKLNQENLLGNNIQKYLSPKLVLLHPIISAMSTQFPDPRLIQYDCGKLQTLDKVLRKLKGGGHRVLIFTQMTRMLDVLEAFLNYHGHIYLRLDGTTKIEQRQILMERFNGDKRIFVFILSTRSGGVGVNLTGADTVIFYDSDWNPTMDAQAQDRCHRIGQTRDVHIYRLISEKTIEENILKKANQKRLLGDLAIEGGNFTTAYFKSSTIQDIFNVDQTEDNASARLSEIIDQNKDRRRLQDNLATNINSVEDKTTINIFENALAAAEDEQDVEAATTAKAEAAADLAEFDETIPIEEIENKPELSKAEQEVENLIKQLSPIERYAMRFVEETGDSWTAEQLRQAEAEIENQKREWEANRLATIKKEEEEIKKNEAEENEMLTFSAEDAKNQIWISNNSVEKMPMWCPPTPPQDDNDVYKDFSLSFLYDPEMIPETQLPPVYIKKEFKRNRIEAGFYADGRRPIKIRKEDNYYPPRSLFDRPSPAIAKMRRDLKLQRYRGIFKPSVQMPGLKQQIPIKPLIEPEGMAEWFIYEDMAILNVIQNLQGLPLNLMFLSPGHTPNWDLVADIVNQSARIHRSAKQCRYRYEAVIVPREEGKLLESPKKQKKNKNPMKLSLKSVRSMRTAQSYLNDNNNSFTKLIKLKFESIKTAYLKKAPNLKQILVNPSLRNPKHAAVLQDFGITNYDTPPTPVDIALRRVERLTKDKQKAPNLPTLQISDLSQSQTNTQQQQQNQQSQQQQTQQPGNIVIQQTLQPSNPVTTNVVQTAPIQLARPVSTISMPQQTQQVVKTIVATQSSSNLVSNTLHQQLANQSQIQLTTQSQQVSVVLTTPVTTISSMQQSNQPQIVSIQQNIVNNNTIVTQTTSLMQTHPTQSMPQVVSVSQLGNVGTVISTSGLQSNQNVTTLTSSPLRTQRIVTTPGGLQEVVLHPRSGSQSPTVVSVSSLGPGLTQGQLQAAQLRLQMSAGQQVSGVVAKGIQVSAIQNTGKPTNTTPIQFYRHQNLRQQFKVLHTSSGQGGTTVVQTAGGQATLVAPGTIIQGGIVQQNVGQTVQVQSASGQKMSVATIGSVNSGVGTAGVVTSVATVQVAPGQARTQFIKHVGNKQTIARQVTESEVQALMIKRQILSQQHKAQGGVQQTQIFAPSVQLQQPGTSGQQIATLVKTSSGSVSAATLSQVKAGQIKATMANPNQVRQLQLQQQIALAQQRKGGKMTQFTHVAGKGGVATQLIVQNPKALPGTVTVQQIQQVIRHAQPGQIVLGKTGVSRVIPGSVAQANARQTIQVLTATSAAGNIRHVTGTQNLSGIQGTIKVTSSGATVQQQQALINALQHQRQNPSPVRIQTTQGSLVAVTVQQQQPTTVVSVSSSQQTNTHDAISNITTTTLHNQQQQQQSQSQQQNQQPPI